MKGRISIIVALLLVAGACSDLSEVPLEPTPATLEPNPPDTAETAPPGTAIPGTTTTTTGTSTSGSGTETTAPSTQATIPPPTKSIDDTTLALALVASGITQPVFLDAPLGDDRLFIVDQAGVIWIVEDGERLATPFLDINERVNFSGEMGMLGLAFHPGYDANGRFFVHYTDNGLDTRISEFTVSGDRNVADEGSERLLLGAAQPAGNHNGGMIAFGPDGYLYIGLGDGGASDDRFRNGQNLSSLLGALLRIDVDGSSPYAIPADNPFSSGATSSGGEARGEIWAYGLRNPWRFSFDAGRIYIGDVGQRRWEEVNVASADTPGLNYGWSIMEGLHCFRPSSGCDQSGIELPVLEYSHGPGCSVTGGYVYRGSAIPQLNGHYFFGDFCSGRIESFLYDGSEPTDRRDWTSQLGTVGSLTSFGTDGSGELYVLRANGQVYKIVER